MKGSALEDEANESWQQKYSLVYYMLYEKWFIKTEQVVYRGIQIKWGQNN